MYCRNLLQTSYLKLRTRSLVLRRCRAPCFSASVPLKIAGRHCSPLPHPSPQSAGPVESGFTSTASIAIVATSLGAASLYLYQYLNPSTESDPGVELKDFENTQEYAIMSGISLPGRPGNLTAEQEAKLKEMWAATLSVFGLPELGDTNGDASSTIGSETMEQTEQKSRAGTFSSEKKKKKRIGMFSRKHNDDVLRENVDGVSAMDGDDKYGQTKAYRKVLESQSPEDLRHAFWSMVKHDNPDGLLLRFLRARKWDVQNALIMLVAAMHWRMQEMHVDDDIIRKGEAGSLEDSASSNAAVKKEGEDFLAQLKLGKSFLHGTDREGRPMCFVRVRLHKQGEQSEASVERFTVYTIETARYLLGSNVDTAVSELRSQ